MKSIPVSKLNQNPLEEIRKKAYNAIAQKIATSSNTVVTTVNDE
jgi:oligoendopeptidase F